MEELRAARLKGKAEPVAAFRLLACVRSAGACARVALRRPRPRARAAARRVGRARSSGGRCELVTIVGEPGVGKSRLVAELIAGLEARVVSGRCLSYGEGITYWPVVEVIKQLGALPADAAAAAALRSLLGRERRPQLAGRDRVGVRQAARAGRPAPRACSTTSSGVRRRSSTSSSMSRCSRPAHRCSCICLARPELSERRGQWPVALRLQPLGEPEVEALLSDAVPPGLRERIARAAGGNPLFVTEMIAMTAGAGGEVVVPATLKALLAARLDQLESAERGVLERGSVEGEVFHRGPVQALVSAESQVTSQLSSLVRKELIRTDKGLFRGEDAFRFCHLLIRDAAYDALPKATRAELHERFADWLDHHGAELVERDEITGYHLEQAHRYRVELGEADDEETRSLGVRAAARLVSAGRRAATSGDHHAVANLLGRALELGLPTHTSACVSRLSSAASLHETGRLSDSAAMLAEASRPQLVSATGASRHLRSSTASGRALRSRSSTSSR